MVPFTTSSCYSLMPGTGDCTWLGQTTRGDVTWGGNFEAASLHSTYWLHLLLTLCLLLSPDLLNADKNSTSLVGVPELIHVKILAYELYT